MGAVRVGVRYVREDVTINNSAGIRICRVIMGDARVIFDIFQYG
jgi:hypothetical protein